VPFIAKVALTGRQPHFRETIMNLEILVSFLAWCTLINLVILIIWRLVLAFAGGWMRGMHRKWFDLSDESFAAVHYKLLAYFKVLWVVFNLTPYLALRLFVLEVPGDSNPLQPLVDLQQLPENSRVA
jgi:hypothetical protein